MLPVLGPLPACNSSQLLSCGPQGAFEDVFPEVFRELHGIAESMCTSNSFRALFMEVLELHVLWIYTTNSSELSSIVELQLFSCSMLSFVALQFFDMFDHTCGHVFFFFIGPGRYLYFCPSPPDRINDGQTEALP